MVQVSYPGVYIQEVPSGVRTIAAVSTSVTAFIGRTFTGPVTTPTLLLSFADFERAFGTLEQNAGVGDMAQQVKQFFLNGGQQAWVTRLLSADAMTAVADVSNGPAPGAAVARISGPFAGQSTNGTTVVARPGGLNPDDRFNLEIGLGGTTETYTNLSMDPSSPRFVGKVVNEGTTSDAASTLVSLSNLASADSPSVAQAGKFVPEEDGNAFETYFNDLFGLAEPKTSLQLSIDGGQSFLEFDISSIDTSTPGAAATDLQGLFNTAFATSSIVVTFETDSGLSSEPNLLRISSADFDVEVQSAPLNDIALELMLGSSNGGFTAGRFSGNRMAVSGTASGSESSPVARADLLVAVGSLQAAQWPANLTVDSTNVPMPSFPAGGFNSPTTAGGLGAALDLVVDAINDQAGIDTSFRYGAERLGATVRVFRVGDDMNVVASISDDSGSGDFGAAFSFAPNVQRYVVGAAPAAPAYQVATQVGTDGTLPPGSAEYEAAYTQIEKDVDLFNLLVLPLDAEDADGLDLRQRWARASVFCQEQRAFLLIDPPEQWNDVQDIITGPNSVNSLRVGVVNDHSAVYFPKVCIQQDGAPNLYLGPSGTIAGLMARTDANRGVWKAPAGTEAELRGTNGLEFNLSDRENGVINPRGVNALRVFPNGLVSWGARTLDGDDDFGSEWKYVPVRRTALFIEESLFRGLRFAVFEPNDEPLWSQIRLNVGAFMNNLFRQGAFQGRTARDAYFVKCDADTTTQNDINLGIVNVLVGFAPLKPAEFVVLRIQQLAGQVQT